MELNEYQKRARKTRLPTANEQYCLLNLSAEVGELLGHIAKSIRKNTSPDRNTIAKELGDVLWQVSAVADDFGLALDNVAVDNLDKLADREQRGVLIGSGDNR